VCSSAVPDRRRVNRSDTDPTLFATVRNAHEAAGGRALGERYAVAVPRPFQFNFLAV
jgi:hypothetical protein